ncbi:MAG TPA: DUF983 domain-containing protein [Roseiflexaceae bacterium]|nr:DUF983 domain-containing protein [Roseiflexaceae bacterium]
MSVSHMFRAFFAALLLRCPRCLKGSMFTSFFHMRQHCPVCDLPFERASGEITGGMGINIVVTLLLVIIVAPFIGFSTVPLMPAFLVMGTVVILFPIVFYPFSRSLWASFLYVTGDNEEPD